MALPSTALGPSTATSKLFIFGQVIQSLWALVCSYIKYCKVLGSGKHLLKVCCSGYYFVFFVLISKFKMCFKVGPKFLYLSS